MTNFKDLDFLVESLRKVDTGKNHILITGNIKVGKSTLLKAFIKKYYKNYNFFIPVKYLPTAL